MKINLGSAPVIDSFYGREEEFLTIKDWLLHQKCQLISFLGIPGIGKTAFAVKVAQKHKEDFQYVFWINSLNFPSFEAILQNIVDAALDIENDRIPDDSSASSGIDFIISCFQNKRCLLILDNIDSRIQSDASYQIFLQSIAKKQLQSCIIITSRSITYNQKNLDLKDTKIKSLVLGKLKDNDILNFLVEKGIDLSNASQENIKYLTKFFGGLPFALSIAVPYILKHYKGDVFQYIEEISSFRENSSYSNDNIRELIDKAFKSLSIIDEKIIYFLAVNLAPTTVDKIKNNIVDINQKKLISKSIQSLVSQQLVEKTAFGYSTHSLIKEYAKSRLINNIFNQKNYTKDNQEINEVNSIVRSIEFPPEYREAGTSILMYFNHILGVKYPDKRTKVRIEQDGITLRMIIHTQTGCKEIIEETLSEYGMVVTGKLEPENFLSDPLEVIALKNKLEIANLELRQSKQLLSFAQNINSQNQKRIESLEVQVSKLHCIIEQGLQSSNHAFGVIKKMTELEKSTYNLNQAKFGGGFAAENGFQVGGNFIDLSNSSNLTDAAQQIQDILNQLQNQGDSEEEAIQKVASDLAKQADDNPTVLGKLVKYGKFIADAAGKTTVSEAVKGAISLALQMLNI